MVGIRNSTMEVQVDEVTRNWVANHVASIVTPLNEKIKNLTNSVNQLVLAQQYNNIDSWRGVTWAEYEEVMHKRFGDANEDHMAELKNLRHKTTMKMFKPRSLEDAFSLSSLQETTLVLVKQRYTIILLTPRTTATSTFVNRTATYPAKNTKGVDKKRAKNQCFYYDQKYMPGHKCEGQIFTLEIRGEEDEIFEDCLGEGSNEMTEYVLPEEVPQYTTHISLNSLSGIPTHNTMRVRGHVLNQLLHILIDSDSTHNFLDMHKANKLGCQIRKTYPLSVSVAGGSKKIVLRGTNQSELTWMSGKSISKQINQQDAYLTSIFCMAPSATLHLMQCGNDHEISGNVRLQALLEEYANVFEEPKALPPHRSFDHQIPLKYRDVNVNIRPYMYLPAQKDVIETMVKELLDSGVIRPSHSPFSSLIVMVKKKDGAQVFPKLDLRLWYHQIRIKEEDVLDEICVQAILEKVCIVMRMNTLFSKKSKCVFGTSRVEYLGHVITGEGVETDPSKIQAMKEWPVPINIKQLRGFIGLIGYYRRFIKGYAIISQPLTALLKRNAFQWSSQTQTAFEKLKQAMINSPVLALLNFNKGFVIETDASGVGIGAVLQQQGHPIAYLSKTLATKHQSLSAYEKELLVVVMALQKWRVFHVSQIKACHFDVHEIRQFPQCDAEGLLAANLFKLLERRIAKQGNEAVVFGLIQWSNGREEDATWEMLSDIVKRFPEFVLDP
ncbi:gypsy/ty3 retroelement polyprotein [Tanacetum coccineum]